MQTRKVTVFNMGDNSSRSVLSSATTWGELKANHSEIRGMLADDMKVVLKQNKMTIETDGALLPAEELTIYLTPGKVKSGAKKGNYRTELRERVTPVIAEAKTAIAKDLAKLKAAITKF